ncbi:MAG: putative membrane protein, partial [Myxococcota bacterium]
RRRSIVRQRDFGVKANVVSNRRIGEMAAFLADVDRKAAKEIVYKPWYTNIVGWSLVGAGVVTAAVSIPFYSKFLDKKDFVEANPLGLDPTIPDDRAELLGHAEEGNDAQTTAGILVGVGSALIVGGALAFVFYKVEDDGAAAEQVQTGLRFIGAPFATPDGGGFVFGGQF